MIDLLKEESRLRQEHIQQIKEQHDAEEKAHHEDAQARAGGYDGATNKALTALTEAESKRDATKPGSKERAAADDEVSNRNADLRDSRRADAEKAAHTTELLRLAAMTGSDREKERQRLYGEQRKQTARFMDPSSPIFETDSDKQQEASDSLIEINRQIATLDRADKQAEFQRRRDEISAGTGIGPKEKVKGIDALSRLNADEQNDNADHEKDINRASKLNAEAAQLLRTRKEITFQANQELETAQATTRTMASQMAGHAATATIEKIRAEYEQKISKALEEGKDDLAQQYSLQEQMALIPALASAGNQTPAEQAEQARAFTRQQHAALNAMDRHGTHDANAVGGSSIHDANAVGGSDIPEAGTGHGALESPDNAGINFGDISKNFTMPSPSVDVHHHAPSTEHSGLTNEGLGAAVAAALEKYLHT